MLKDMSLSKEEAKEYNGMCCSDGSENGPKYPYGLCIELNDGSLEKLGINELPAVGKKVLVFAEATVTSISQYQEQSGESESRLSLQITSLDIEMPTAEKNAAAKMWPNMQQDD